ncbi:4718_t:CDS:2, partial [Entrophospora sp. SA101]
GNGNSPVFQSSINEFVVNSNDMTNSVNAVYDQYLQSNKNQLENCFNISNNLITAAGKYARIYGEGAPTSQEDH